MQFVAAFDVDAKKVGRDLAEAIVASENNTIKIADVPPLGVPVQRGPTLDGLGQYYREIDHRVRRASRSTGRGAARAGADVLVSYLPVGSRAGRQSSTPRPRSTPACAFVNALPVFIAGTRSGRTSSPPPGCRSSVTTSRARSAPPSPTASLAKLFEDRGVQLDRTMQLNVGGNMDFMNMLERERLESKKISKTQSVTSQVDRDMGKGNVHIGPSDHVPWLDDRKWAYVRLEGRAFGDVPLNLEYKLEVWDSPNSAGIIIDAVRAAKIALDRGIGGPILSASSYFMKSPPEQYSDSEARDAVEAFIRGDVER